jgi:hypothetical protein
MILVPAVLDGFQVTAVTLFPISTHKRAPYAPITARTVTAVTNVTSMKA